MAMILTEDLTSENLRSLARNSGSNRSRNNRNKDSDKEGGIVDDVIAGVFTELIMKGVDAIWDWFSGLGNDGPDTPWKI